MIHRDIYVSVLVTGQKKLASVPSGGGGAAAAAPAAAAGGGEKKEGNLSFQ